MMIITMIIVQVGGNECFPVEYTWSWLFRLESMTKVITHDFSFLLRIRTATTYWDQRIPSTRVARHEVTMNCHWWVGKIQIKRFYNRGASTSVFADNFFASFLLILFRRDREGKELVLTWKIIVHDRQVVILKTSQKPCFFILKVSKTSTSTKTLTWLWGLTRI